MAMHVCVSVCIYGRMCVHTCPFRCVHMCNIRYCKLGCAINMDNAHITLKHWITEVITCVFMFVYIHAYVIIRVSLHACTYVSVAGCACLYVCVWTRVSLRVCVKMRYG